MYNKNVRYRSNYNLIESNLVSIIIGAKCENSIIIASDSQATDKRNLTKKYVDKIFKKEVDNSVFIYSGAERPDINELVFDEAMRNYKSNLDFSIICRNAISKIKEEYPDVRNENGLLPFRMLVGILNKTTKKLELYHVKPEGIVIPTKQIEPIGSRCNLAESTYRLYLSYAPDQYNLYSYEDKILEAILIAIYRIKQFDLYCGGDFQYKILKNTGDIKTTDKDYIKKMENKIIPELLKNHVERMWSDE